MVRVLRQSVGLAMIGVSMAVTMAVAQDAPAPQHEHTATASGSTWQFMQDGILFTEFNHQGSSRGGSELVVPTWWMGMASRTTSRGQLSLTTMLSLDPALVGKKGYREIFQVGEALDGRPLVDRQHPHDLFMQIAAVWRVPLANSTSLTLAGGPVGEPAIGPVAFMHRASAADNPTAPLGHHTFDSTHIAFGVVTAAVDHGPWLFEGSLFNGREPDENRWDFDLGRLDSFSGWVWFRPTAEWEFQVSAAHLTDPEELEPGNIRRTTASASWTRVRGADVTALTVAFGRNDSDHGARNAVLVEAAHRAGSTTIYGRLEGLQVETGLLLTAMIPNETDARAKDSVVAFTIGGVREVLRVGGFEVGIGGDLNLYGVPDALRATRGVCSALACVQAPGYGSNPVSFHVFLRVHPSPAKGRMWNMRMSQPMSHATTAPTEHSHH